MENFQTELEKLQSTFKQREIQIVKPESEFPELWVYVPDDWPTVTLAPWYDVHFGSSEQDLPMFYRHRDWMAETPYVLSFDGGDMYENANPNSPGASVMVQDGTPQSQMERAEQEMAPVQHKLMFKLPGNHEDRSMNAAGVDTAKQFADDLKIPYFADYCFCTIKWRGNNFRLCAHHGAGGATTPGAQRNVARKDMTRVRADIYWTGHLHQPMADIVYATDFNQATGEMVERDSVVIISPSYVKYFGGYSAKKRMLPGSRGLGVIVLQDDGRIDVSMHAHGKRL